MIIRSKILDRMKKADSKDKRLLRNTGLTLLVKGGALLVSFLTIPAYLRFFQNHAVLGLWFTALSMLSWVLTFDLGVGNGLRNHIVQPLLNGDVEKIRKYVSSAYIMIGAIVLIASSLGYVLFQYVRWNVVFNISSQIVSPSALLAVVRLLFAGIMVQFFLRLLNSILLAMQKPAIPDFLALVSSTLLLLFVLLGGTGDTATKLRMLSIAFVVTANLPILVATVLLFLTSLRDCAPSLKHFSKPYAKDIIALGGTFFWLQIMFMLVANTNEFLITWFIGTAEVVDYKIYNVLFGLIGTLFFLAIKPVWSEVTEASTRREYPWIKRLYSRLSMMALFATGAEFALVFFSQPVVNIWLKKKQLLSTSVMPSFSPYRGPFSCGML